jgi:hypothetical protein
MSRKLRHSSMTVALGDTEEMESDKLFAQDGDGANSVRKQKRGTGGS